MRNILCFINFLCLYENQQSLTKPNNNPASLLPTPIRHQQDVECIIQIKQFKYLYLPGTPRVCVCVFVCASMLQLLLQAIHN